jgi:hypothetical protein
MSAAHTGLRGAGPLYLRHLENDVTYTYSPTGTSRYERAAGGEAAAVHSCSKALIDGFW